MKGANGLRITRHQGGADEVGKLQNGQLFWMVTQGTRFVEHARALTFGLLQQVGGVEILAVKRWVFAHHDGVHRVKGLVLARHFFKPSVRCAGEVNLPQRRPDLAATDPGDVLRLAGIYRVATTLRLAHHGKGRVLVDLEGVQRIGDEQQLHSDLDLAAHLHHGVAGQVQKVGSCACVQVHLCKQLLAPGGHATAHGGHDAVTR